MTEDVFKSRRAAAPRRYLALWFAHLPTDRLRRLAQSRTPAEPDERPLITILSVKGATRIASADRRALHLGLAPGITLADARARIPDLAVVAADPVADQSFLDHLATLCDRFTPLVALDPPDGLILDITGCAHLFGGEAHLRRSVITRMIALRLGLNASIAGTPDAAKALSRFSRVEITPEGEDERSVRRLPVAALSGVSRETILALSRAGLKTIGDLSDRPAQGLAERFGQDLVTRLNRTLGRENIRISPLRPLPAIIVERQFVAPLTQMENLQAILAELIDDGCLIMQERGQGGRVFEASFYRSDGVVRRLAVQTGRPSRDVAAITMLYRERFDTLADPLDPGFGFDAIRLSVPLTEPLETLQTCLDAKDEYDHALSDLIDRLTTRLGRDRVLRFEAQDTHDPSRQAILVPAAQATASSPLQRDVSGSPAWPRPLTSEPPRRPLQLFDPPQPIETLAEVPDGPPMRFRWRHVLHDIARAEGPERIAPEWWRKSQDVKARDYYRVEDTYGCRFWIFREGIYGQPDDLPRWFLHGLFA